MAKTNENSQTNVKEMKKGFNKAFAEHRIAYIIVYIIFTLYAITLLYPLLWVFVQSFRTKFDFFWYPLEFPQSFYVENYLNIFTQYNMAELFANSIVLSVGGAFASILASSCAAYVVSKYNFKLRNVIYGLVIVTMIIPTTGSIATTYRLMNDTGLAGTHIGLIIMYSGGFGFNFFLLYGFFKNLSMTYAESAKIDGAGHATIFFRIMLPLAKPSLFAVGIITFIGYWNDYYAPYMYLRNYPTLAVGIYQMSSDITTGANSYDYPALFAIMTISVVPIIVLFSIFQKTIMENMVAGGIKG